MNELKEPKQMIDEEHEEITMSKAGWVHLNYINVCRNYRASDFIKARRPMDSHYLFGVLDELFHDNGGRHLEAFVHLFIQDEPDHQCEETDWNEWEDECDGCNHMHRADNRGMTEQFMSEFEDFCAGFKMTWMMSGESQSLEGKRIMFPLIVDFVNRTRDFLIDDESDDTKYIGRWTMRKLDSKDAMFFQNNAIDNYISTYTVKEEEE